MKQQHHPNKNSVNKQSCDIQYNTAHNPGALSDVPSPILVDLSVKQEVRYNLKKTGSPGLTLVLNPPSNEGNIQKWCVMDVKRLLIHLVFRG